MGFSGSLLILLATTFFILSLSKRALIIVPSERTYVVERLGKFFKVLKPGLHCIIPFIDRVIREYHTDGESVAAPEQQCRSYDGAMLGISATINYVVTDAQRATYEISDVAFTLLQTLQRVLPQVVSQVSANSIRSRPGILEPALIYAMQTIVQSWAIKVTGITLAAR